MLTKSYKELQQELTPKQCQALLLMVRKPGMTHKQIAAELGVSHHTVSSYNRSEVFRAAYEALTTDLEALSIGMMQQLRTESERLALDAIQVLRNAIADPAMKPSEKLPLLSEAARWFSLLHPEPKNGLAVSASALAGDAQAHSTVFIYSGSEPEEEQKATLTADSQVAIWLPHNDRDVIDVSGSSSA